MFGDEMVESLRQALEDVVGSSGHDPAGRPGYDVDDSRDARQSL